MGCGNRLTVWFESMKDFGSGNIMQFDSAIPYV